MKLPPSEKRPYPAFVVFTDLDGTLLDAGSYSFEAAAKALHSLRTLRVPLVIVSSKTRAEIESIRRALGCEDPFIVENGGAVVVPSGYFRFPLDGAIRRDGYHMIEFGIPYTRLRQALADINGMFGGGVKGFGDMSADEVAALTGLTLVDARLALQREYDEPFVLEESPHRLEELKHLAETHGLSCVSGGRFHHLVGPHDKGHACRYLIGAYRRHFSPHSRPPITIALGDSQNDLPMLASVDRPILVARIDGSHDPAIDLPHLTRTPGVGPAGWNAAIIRLLGEAPGAAREDEGATQDIPEAGG